MTTSIDIYVYSIYIERVIYDASPECMDVIQSARDFLVHEARHVAELIKAEEIRHWFDYQRLHKLAHVRQENGDLVVV